MESVARKPRMTRHDGISGARACIKNLANYVADRRRPICQSPCRDILADHGALANWILADYRVTTVRWSVWKHDFGIRQSRDVQAERDACWEIHLEPSEQPPYKLSGGIRWYGGFVPS